jgi:cytochrome c-type biogenesis protein CcmE
VKGLYIRWVVVIFVGLVIAWFAAQHYDREVKPITPEALLQTQPVGTVRVIGRVQAGSLTITPPESRGGPLLADFELAGEQAHLAVHYDGPEDDNLRELKTLVVVGHLNPGVSPGGRRFEAHEFDLLPNYGFITAAYLLALIPLGLFLFGMERRVALLYTVMKETTVYQPEADAVE